MINKDPKYKHAYDSPSNMTCCTLEEKMNAKANQSISSNLKELWSNIKNLLFFPVAIIILLLLNSCGSSVKLIYTSSQIRQPDTTAYKSIRKAFWSDSLIVKTTDKKKQMLAPDAIWGCDYKNRYYSNIYYRYYRGRFFYVREMDSLFIYSIHHSSRYSQHTHFYFSKTPDAEIFPLNKKTIRIQFSNNSCLLNKLNNLKWYQSLSDYDRKKQSYRITEVYKECKK